MPLSKIDIGEPQAAATLPTPVHLLSVPLSHLPAPLSRALNLSSLSIHYGPRLLFFISRNFIRSSVSVLDGPLIGPAERVKGDFFGEIIPESLAELGFPCGRRQNTVPDH